MPSGCEPASERATEVSGAVTQVAARPFLNTFPSVNQRSSAAAAHGIAPEELAAVNRAASGQPNTAAPPLGASATDAVPADPAARLAASRREFGEYGGVNAGIECSTTFTVLDADTLPQIFAGEKGPTHGCYLYGRSFNPTVRYLGRQLAAMEGGDAAYCCASGLAAISATLLALCNAGDHIVASHAVYGGTFALLKDFLPQKCGIHTTFVDISSPAAVAAAITDRTRLVYTESLSNPTLVLADIPTLAELAHAQGLKLVVDNTFTPMVLSPLRLGADVVVHSLTKFVSGASDIIAGAVCAADGRFINSLMDLHMGPLMLLGPTMDPKVASELSLRIPHLALRMREHSARAQRYAEGLHGLGAKVVYPGLPSHPQHALMKRLANPGYGYGGMLTVELSSLERAKSLMERLQNKHSFGLMAVSLGYFDTLLSASAASTSSELSEVELAQAGIGGGLVRISVGLTGSVEQRWGQLEEAYCHVQGVPLGSSPAASPPALPAHGIHQVTGDVAARALHRFVSLDSKDSLQDRSSMESEDASLAPAGPPAKLRKVGDGGGLAAGKVVALS